MKVSIVIPCYNSELFLEKTFSEIKNSMKNYNYEVILINDSSKDNTYKIIEKIAKHNKNVIGVSFAKNFGQHAALMAGFSMVSGDVIVCMDDDGQTPASEIPKLINGLTDDVDVVYAKYKIKKHSFFRNFGSKVNNKMAEVMIGKPKKLSVTSFFCARRYVIDEVLKYKNSYPYVIGLILRTTNRIINVEVEHKSREIGNSGYSLKKLLSLWMNGFTTFSVKPLRIADILGAITALCGFIYMLIIIIRKLFFGYESLQGWSSLVSITLFIGGIIMLILGLIGEYLGRVYICNSNAPQYVIRNTTFGDKKNEK